jgi:hypothetical protein
MWVIKKVSLRSSGPKIQGRLIHGGTFVEPGIAAAYFTIRSFFTDLTPLTLLVISMALSTAF